MGTDMRNAATVISRKMHIDKTIAVRVREILIYGLLYILAFAYLENRIIAARDLTVSIDYSIPFCAYFIIPYVLWYGYVGVTLFYFAIFNKDDAEYYKLTRSLCFGCTLFIIISWLFPNGQMLRPHLYGGNVFERMVMALYRNDTCTNIFPSIHVFNSVACMIAWHRSRILKGKRGVCFGVSLLTLSIVLSTMFLKQHTVVDVVGALILNLLCFLYYYTDSFAAIRKAPKKRIA